MRFRNYMTVVALLALVTWNIPQLAYAHGGGGGGGHGGGGFGGGGFGGGHGGGFGGGHMGGFGGGHMGGFGGGHMGGFGGGHYGGFSGGHYGGFSSGLGGHHSGIGGAPIGGSMHSGGIGHYGGIGGTSGLSGVGGHHAAGNLGAVHQNPNSFTSRHMGGHNLTNGAAGNRVMSGYRGVNGATFAGTHAQGLLNHQASGLANHSNFLQHHHVSPISTGGTGRGLTGGTGMGQHHHGGMNGNGFNNMHHHNHGFFGGYPFFGFGFPFFGFGYPFYGYGLYGLGYGYGGYGYGGYGYGYNPYAYYYPYGYGYGMYGYPYAYGSYPAANAQVAQPALTGNDAEVFAQKGENDFKAGDYKGAVYAWRHALVDDPQNGVLMMMLAQGLFATGSYNEAAGAVQQAMQLLPEDQWGVVVSNYKELYGKIGDYTSQLRALEKAVKQNADDPGARFLLGYHYGYLGYPQQAVKQLDKTLELAPADQLAKKLRDQFNAKLSKPADGQAAPDKEAGGGQPKGNQAGNKIVADKVSG